MAWFAVACVLGFFIYRRETRRWFVIIGVVLLLGIIVATEFTIFKLLETEAYSREIDHWTFMALVFRSLFPDFDSGIITRTIFGAVLGFGLAYSLDERDYGGVPRRSPLTGESRHTYMSLGLAVLLLALVGELEVPFLFLIDVILIPLLHRDDPPASRERVQRF